jgi:heme/copper-type cytochrome/quinol oxidase subunit 2
MRASVNGYVDTVLTLLEYGAEIEAKSIVRNRMIMMMMMMMMITIKVETIMMMMMMLTIYDDNNDNGDEIKMVKLLFTVIVFVMCIITT